MPNTVSTVLERKGYNVVTVAQDDSVAEVVRILSRNRIGAVPVLDGDGRLVGIISERDIVSGTAAHGDRVLALRVDQLMTREVKTCSPDDHIIELMETMTLQRIRHLPVVRSGQLLGIVSIGDVVKQRLEEAQSELEALRTYIASAS
jgi:CBS domain-containing protein